jgi:hypothetical protein
LEQLYIPEEDPYFGSNLSSKQKVSDKKEILLDQLLDEAFKLTGNKRVDSQPKTSVTARWILEHRWWPSGIYLFMMKWQEQINQSWSSSSD